MIVWQAFDDNDDEQSLQPKQLTSTGIVSPGKTNIESPTRTSSVGTSTHIASALSALSVEGSLSEEAITKRDCEDTKDWKKKHCIKQHPKLYLSRI